MSTWPDACLSRFSVSTVAIHCLHTHHSMLRSSFKMVSKRAKWRKCTETLAYRVPRVWTQHYCIYGWYLCTSARAQRVNINYVCCGFHLPWFGSVVISLFTDTPVRLWCVYTQLCYRITIVPSILTLVFQWTQSGSPDMSHIRGHTVCNTCIVEGTFERKTTQKDAWVYNLINRVSSCENEFYLHENEKSSLYQRLCT